MTDLEMQFTSFNFPILVAAVIIILITSVIKKKLTIWGALTAAVIGFLVLSGAGINGSVMLLAFFVLSVLATSHKKTFKLKHSPKTSPEKGRTAGQVFANGGVAGIAAILAVADQQHREIYILMLAASLASAFADTLSSELGMVYGSKFFNILTFKREANGLDGVISVEGTLIGAFGACIIGIIYSGNCQTSIVVAVAGIFGNLMDSVLGALLERKNYITNNTVNFLNTIFAALSAGTIYSIIFL